MERRDKVNYYLDLAKMVAQRSTCLRRHYGAVIVKNDEVISTGYVGAPRRESVYVKRWKFRGVSGMNCAAASTRRPMRSSARRGTK